MSDCERCDGTGEIQGSVETVRCPNCEDVCQWCNNPFEDGEQLGETGLSVCRPCIRDMAKYKEDVAWQLFVSIGVDELVETPDELREDLDAAIKDTFADYDLNAPVPDGWEVRNDPNA